MGVDTLIKFVHPPFNITAIEAALTRLFPDGTFYDDKCLITDYESENTGDIDKDTYELNYWGRAWTPNYRRGNLIEIIAVCEVLMGLLPDCKVFLGNDSDFVWHEMTVPYVKSLWRSYSGVQ